MSKGNRKRRRELGLLPAPEKCGARTRSGTPCSNPPLAGATRCRMHGAAAPQVQRKAKERLLEKVPAMLKMLYQLANDETVPPAVRLAAIRDWLDRAGINAKTEIEITVGGWQEVLVSGITSEVPDHAIPNGQDYSGYAAMNGLALDNIVDAEVVDETETP